MTSTAANGFAVESWRELDDRARRALAPVPRGAFTMEDFVNACRQIGLDDEDHFGEVALILRHLIETGLILLVPGRADQPLRWVCSSSNG
jgi:hypothetical protein